MKKPTTWRLNSRLRVSDKPLKKTAVRKRNGPRLAKRRREEYGKHADWVVASFHCFVCEANNEVQYKPTVPAHASKTRGGGGKARHICDMCVDHENLWHSLGPETFDAYFSVDCKARAAYLWSISPFNPDNVSGEP